MKAVQEKFQRIQEQKRGAGEMAQQLMLTALAENLGFGSTLGKAQVSVTLVTGDPRGFPWAPVCTWNT